MEHAFRPIPLDVLARWLFAELDAGGTVLGIPRQNFEVPGRGCATEVNGVPLAAPLGVAAGPHTQLAQNIVAAWLCGARFIELKTVQVLDEIKVARPCIDALDAAYNCEWSQELKLAQSFDEYLKAWVLVHAVAHRLGLAGPGVLFNMSVGYDLAGVQSPSVQAFIASMRDAGAALPAAIEAVAAAYPAVRDLAIPSELSSHITLSTMHGCPPAEIERIARYLLTELGVHTWIKLNPTLLGPVRLREILNKRLGHDIEVPDAAFEHDPRFEDALAMILNLEKVADGRSQRFGIKLSNTLEVKNCRPVFPASEKMMYLSGRALHPITRTLAAEITAATGGRIPISFCGGADAQNFAELVADGLGPVTVCTDLLKPGGYARLQQYLVNLEAAMARARADSIDAFVAGAARDERAAHVAAAIEDPRFAARERPLQTKSSRPLGYFDCISAPCMDDCPTHQNIPDYLWHVAHGDPDRSLDVILRTNAMPGVTGSVCDHPCTERCVRNHYEAPLAIREIKRFAVEHGKTRGLAAGAARDVRVAVVGAGPGGLSAAYFLRQAGFEVTVFEARQELGGMVASSIPAYRLTAETLAGDLDRVRALGVVLRFGQRLGRDLSLRDLREQGFAYTLLTIGASRGKKLGIPGEDAPGVYDALDFLEAVREKRPLDLGARVLVVGGGNSAMDAARSARRLVKDGTVDLVYRRTRAQMPADADEVLACEEEGIGLRDLLAPLRVLVQGGKVTGLVCQRMELGAPDSSGRPRPVPIAGAEITLPCDTLVPAISQEAVLDFLEGVSIERTRDGSIKVDPATRETSIPGLFAGGDLVRGPASIIHAIADGRAAAEEIARRHGAAVLVEPELDKGLSEGAMLDKRARQVRPQTVPVLAAPERRGFDEVLHTFSAEAAALEASRCLDCDELCSLCVTVCPNRANLAYVTEPLRLKTPVLVARGAELVPVLEQAFAIDQRVQIINVGDSCNDCGNCTTFCPTAGAPFRDKPKFWIDRDGFEEATGDAFRLSRQDGTLRIDARIGGEKMSLERTPTEVTYRTERVVARWIPGTWQPIDVLPARPLANGERVNLAPAGILIALLATETILPT